MEIKSESSINTERNDGRKFLSPIHNPQKGKVYVPSNGKQKFMKSVISNDAEIVFSDVTSDSHDTTNITESVLPESTPKSEVHSYKAKLRERFNLVKRQAGKFTYQHNVPSTSKKISRLDVLYKENENIDNELCAYRNKKLKQGADTTNFDTYVFFTENNISCEVKLEIIFSAFCN